MKNNRITPESQKTRLPFAMFLYISLAAVTLLNILYTLGYTVIDMVGGLDLVINDYINYGELYGVFVTDVVKLIINIVCNLIDEILPIVLCICSLIIAILMLLRKRNLLLFIPSAILAVVLGIVAIVAFPRNLIQIFTSNSLHNYYSVEAILPHLYNYLADFIKAIFDFLATVSMTIAWVALSILFISCGKGVIGIFKRAKKLCFIIFCVVLGLCAMIVTADLLLNIFWYLQNLIQHVIVLINFERLGNNISLIYAIVNSAIMPICSMFDPRPIMNILCLIAVFFTGTWLYLPHKKVKKKKRNIDLVEYVELEYSDDNEVTMEVIDGDNDDEFVNISVHRQKAHDE